MKRRVPRPGTVRISALLEQVGSEPPVPAMRSDDERAGAGGVGVVHVGSGLDEHPGRLDVTVTGGEDQRRRTSVHHPEVAGRIGIARRVLQLGPHARACVQVRVVLDQNARDVGVHLGDRPHQSGLPPLALGCVDVGAMFEKLLDRLNLTRPSRGHQRRFAHLE